MKKYFIFLTVFLYIFLFLGNKNAGAVCGTGVWCSTPKPSTCAHAGCGSCLGPTEWVDPVSKCCQWSCSPQCPAVNTTTCTSTCGSNSTTCIANAPSGRCDTTCGSVCGFRRGDGSCTTDNSCCHTSCVRRSVCNLVVGSGAYECTVNGDCDANTPIAGVYYLYFIPASGSYDVIINYRWQYPKFIWWFSRMTCGTGKSLVARRFLHIGQTDLEVRSGGWIDQSSIEWSPGGPLPSGEVIVPSDRGCYYQLDMAMTIKPQFGRTSTETDFIERTDRSLIPGCSTPSITPISTNTPIPIPTITPAATCPVCPTNVTASRIFNTATHKFSYGISWNAAVGATGYDIFRDGIFVVNTTGTSTTDNNGGSGFIAGENHCYVIEPLKPRCSVSCGNTCRRLPYCDAHLTCAGNVPCGPCGYMDGIGQNGNHGFMGHSDGSNATNWNNFCCQYYCNPGQCGTANSAGLRGVGSPGWLYTDACKVTGTGSGSCVTSPYTCRANAGYCPCSITPIPTATRTPTPTPARVTPIVASPTPTTTCAPICPTQPTLTGSNCTSANSVVLSWASNGWGNRCGGLNVNKFILYIAKKEDDDGDLTDNPLSKLFMPPKDEGTNVSDTINGLADSTEYHWQIKVQNGDPSCNVRSGILPFACLVKQPWIQTKDGDVYATGDIVTKITDCAVSCTDCQPFFSTTGDGGYPGLIGRSNNIYDFPGNLLATDKYSALQWNTQRLYQGPQVKYDYLIGRLGVDRGSDFCSAGGICDIPNRSGTYFHGSSAMQLRGMTNSPKKIVIFSEGTVSLISDVSVNRNNGFFGLITKGGITFGSNTKQAEGFYLTDGVLQTESGNPQDEKFQGKGSFIGWGGIVLGRSLQSSDSKCYPAEKFESYPQLYINAPADFSYGSSLFWEATP